MQAPESVRAATTEYRKEMNRFEQWLDECCIQSLDVSARVSDLFDSYQKFTSDKLMSQTAFGLKLGERGFTKKQNIFGQRIWMGVRLHENNTSSETK